MDMCAIKVYSQSIKNQSSKSFETLFKSFIKQIILDIQKFHARFSNNDYYMCLLVCVGLPQVLRTRVCGAGVPVSGSGGVSLLPYTEGRHRQALEITHRQTHLCYR
jgi:hypothetical protein